MEFGLFMMPLHPPYRPLHESWERDLTLLQLADRLGYKEAWIGEHSTDTWENIPAPDLLIAQALKVTKNITLCTGVNLLPLHHPVELAHRIAMLDHLAQGRFQWGIGLRGIASDLELYGLDTTDTDKVRDQGRECLDVILGLWASEDGEFDFKGKFYEVHSGKAEGPRRVWMKPYQKPHPPIGVASNTPGGGSSYELAAEMGCLPLSGSNMTIDGLKSQWEFLEGACASRGTKADRSQRRIGRHIYVGETPERAREEARAVFGAPMKLRRTEGEPTPDSTDEGIPGLAEQLDRLMDTTWIVGDPDECADRIRHLHEELSGFGYLLAVTYDPDNHQLQQRCLELLMTEVAPRIRDL